MESIKPNDLCVAVSKKGLRDSGLQVGDKVLVAGIRPLPAKRSDPYLQRIYMLVMRVVDGKVEIPNNETGDGDNGHRVYLVDPRCLEKVSDEEQEIFNKGLK